MQRVPCSDSFFFFAEKESREVHVKNKKRQIAYLALRYSKL
jgi:hypothetical protein